MPLYFMWNWSHLLLNQNYYCDYVNEITELQLNLKEMFFSCISTNYQVINTHQYGTVWMLT